MAVNNVNITIGAGTVATSYRGLARTTVTVTSASTGTSFVVSAGEAAKLSKDDYIMLSTAAATCTNLALEASALARVTDIQFGPSPNWTVTCTTLGGTPPTTAGGITIMYEDRGATSGPIALKIKTTLTKIQVEQLLDPVEAIRTAREVTVVLPLTEATYENLAFVSGEAPPAAGASALDFGASMPAAARADRVLLRLPAPGGLWRYIVLNKCVSESESELNAAKAAQSTMTATLSALPDTAMTPAIVSMKDA